MPPKKKRELDYTPPSGKIAWLATPTQKHLAESPLTVVTPVTVYAQTWFEARHEACKLMGIPLERICVKVLEL